MADLPLYILREALRILGMDEADVGFTEHAEGLYTRLLEASSPKHVIGRVDISLDGDEADFGTFTVRSANLAKLFRHCKACVLIASTLGAGVDRLISRVQREDMSDAVILDALASALADSRCDEAENEAAASLSGGEHFTMRFSPGYGDVPLAASEDIIAALGATKRIGLSMTSSNMLVPIKSVTAFVGVADRKEERCDSCELCPVTEPCIYRKNGGQCGVHDK